MTAHCSRFGPGLLPLINLISFEKVAPHFKVFCDVLELSRDWNDYELRFSTVRREKAENTFELERLEMNTKVDDEIASG